MTQRTQRIKLFQIVKYILILSFLCLLSCNKRTKPLENAPPKNNFIENKFDWQEGFGLTHNPEIDSIWGKSVKFYLNNSHCDQTAKDFYFGKYRPKDESETTRLLNLVTTENNSLLPFYRWILNKTILIQDGSLGEFTGVPARSYAEKFPR